MPAAWDEAVVFKVDDVARYLHQIYGYSNAREMDVQYEFPNVAPLADVAWFEWSYPYPHPLGFQIEKGRSHVASAVMVCVMADRHNEPMCAALQQYAAGRDIVSSMRDPARWCLHLHPVWLMNGASRQSLGFLPDLLRIDVATDGHVCGIFTLSPRGVGELSDPLAARLLGYTQVVLTATCFAHCKGVQLNDHEQPRQQRRSAQREGHPPLVSYKTVDIAPVTRILREEGDIEKGGLKKALHICRGHFAHYTDERPLFGKYTGTFFRPMHMRGRLDAGLALKDYRVLSGDGPQRD